MDRLQRSLLTAKVLFQLSLAATSLLDQSVAGLASLGSQASLRHDLEGEMEVREA
jgi:hypothetical protein